MNASLIDSMFQQQQILQKKPVLFEICKHFDFRLFMFTSFGNIIFHYMLHKIKCFYQQQIGLLVALK